MPTPFLMKKCLSPVWAAALIFGAAACVTTDKNVTEIRNDDGSRVVKALSADGTSRTETHYRGDNSVVYVKTYLGMTKGSQPQSAVVKDSSGRVTMSENYSYNATGQLQQLVTLDAQGKVVMTMDYEYSTDGKYTGHRHTDSAGQLISQEQAEAIWSRLEPK